MMNAEYVERVLRIMIKYDVYDGIIPSAASTEDDIKFVVMCNDFFYWGTADGEFITPENIDMLVQAYEDIRAIDEINDGWGDHLFVCRVRNMRPQGACYKNIPESIRHLFDAAGPKREVDFVNPYSHPEDGMKYEYKKPELP